MKALAALALLVASSGYAAEVPYTRPLSIQERILDVDFNVALRQYERVRVEEVELRLKLIRQEANFGVNSVEVRQVKVELEKLDSLAGEVRKQIQIAAEEIEASMKKRAAQQ